MERALAGAAGAMRGSLTMLGPRLESEYAPAGGPPGTAMRSGWNAQAWPPRNINQCQRWEIRGIDFAQASRPGAGALMQEK
jgi:hypothetical protein